jgi:hypothetical protein
LKEAAMCRKIVVGCAVALFAVFMLSPGIAGAAFFDDSGGKWYMNLDDWWELRDIEDVPGVTPNLIDSDDKLNWTVSPAWTGGDESSRIYTSKWGFSPEEDFACNVDFHYDHTGTSEYDEAGVMFGLYCFADGETEDPYTIMVGAGNWWLGAESADKYGSYAELPAGTSEDDWDRTSDEGRLSINYNSTGHYVTVMCENKIGEEYTVAGGTLYGGLDGMEVDQLGAFVGGWSEGAALGTGEAYLTNFEVTQGTMTPEPASVVLFLVGGISLAAARLRKRRK